MRNNLYQCEEKARVIGGQEKVDQIYWVFPPVTVPRWERSQASRFATSAGLRVWPKGGISEVVRGRTSETSLRKKTCSTPPACTNLMLVAPSSLSNPATTEPSCIRTSVVS